jgi:uncharacterized protein YggE
MKRFLMVLGVLLLGAGALHAQETTPNPDQPQPNTITVSGVGTAYGEPNIAYLELGVEIVDPDLTNAYTPAAEAMTTVIQALRDSGIDEQDIQTTGVNIYPEERYPQDSAGATQRVYRVRNIVRVALRDVGQVENVITTAVNAGANTIYNLSFGIEDTQPLESEARVQAVENAQTRAQELADALGVTLGSAISVIETLGSGYPPVPYGFGGAADVALSQPVSQGQLSVAIQVQITFAITD